MVHARNSGAGRQAGGSLGLAAQPVQVKRQAPGSVRDPVLKDKAEKCLRKIADVGFWPPHMCLYVQVHVHTHIYTHMTQR